MIEKATPIWVKMSVTNQYIDAVREFETATLPKKAELEIFAPSGFAAFINSDFAGTSRYRTFSDKAAYITYDITKLIKKGKNTLFITAYNQGLNTSCDLVRTAALCFCIKLDGKMIYSDESTMVRDNPYYENGDMEKVSTQLGYTFHYNAIGRETAWENAVEVKDFSAEFMKCISQN